MKPSEAARYLLQCLQDMGPKLDALDDVEEKVRVAKGELVATKEQVAKVNVELESIRRASKAQLDTEVTKHVEAMDGLAREMAAMQEKTARARQALADLEGLITLKRSEHDQILASIESLRKRLG